MRCGDEGREVQSLRAARVRQNAIVALLLLVMIGILGVIPHPTATMVHNYIKYAVATDFAWSAPNARAGSLSAFIQRVGGWGERIMAPRP